MRPVLEGAGNEPTTIVVKWKPGHPLGLEYVLEQQRVGEGLTLSHRLAVDLVREVGDCASRSPR